MDEWDVGGSIEVGTGALLPGGRITLSMRRRWDRRSKELVDQATRAAGLTIDEMADRIEVNEMIGDLLADATDRVIRVADADYRSDVARLVASAFADDAAVDETSYFLALMTDLQPAEVRAIRTITRLESKVLTDPSELRAARQISTGQVAEVLEVEVGLAGAMLNRLAAQGLVSLDGGKKSRGTYTSRDERRWSITPLGVRLWKLCDGVNLSNKR